MKPLWAPPRRRRGARPKARAKHRPTTAAPAVLPSLGGATAAVAHAPGGGTSTAANASQGAGALPKKSGGQRTRNADARRATPPLARGKGSGGGGGGTALHRRPRKPRRPASPPHASRKSGGGQRARRSRGRAAMRRGGGVVVAAAAHGSEGLEEGWALRADYPYEWIEERDAQAMDQRLAAMAAAVLGVMDESLRELPDARAAEWALMSRETDARYVYVTV
jgi:hypothetical protein